ncbi:hypothetical protein AFK69_19340 [Xenorhabdus sp. GDc328]|nr:hypothetical protein AFK69_19340 [Xenorhabdus sp. GDc328]
MGGALLKGSPLRGLHGAEMASTVTSEERSDCEPGAVSRCGVGAGEVNAEAAGRPACREVCRNNARQLKKNTGFC